jgi:hypothetical protein
VQPFFMHATRAPSCAGHPNVIPGSGVLHTHLRRTCRPRADALLHGVLETCARSRADLGQVLASRTVFSYREPAETGRKTQNFSTPPTDAHTHLRTRALCDSRPWNHSWVESVLLLGEARVARLIDEGDCRGAAPPDPLYLLR